MDSEVVTVYLLLVLPALCSVLVFLSRMHCLSFYEGVNTIISFKDVKDSKIQEALWESLGSHSAPQQ